VKVTLCEHAPARLPASPSLISLFNFTHFGHSETCFHEARGAHWHRITFITKTEIFRRLKRIK